MENEEVATWNIYDIDKNTIANIEAKKIDLLLNFYSLSDSDREDSIKNLILTIKTLMEKYPTFIYNFYVKFENDNKPYSFYDIERLISNTNDIELQKFLLEKIIYIYNQFLRQILRISLPFEKPNPRRKLFDALFSFANIKNYDATFEDFSIEYKKKLESTGLKDNESNFFAYLLSKGREFDLDFVFLIFGYARIGKSTLALDLFARLTSFVDMKPYEIAIQKVFEKQNLQNSFIYSQKEYERFLTQKYNVFIHDEASLTENRRLHFLESQTKFLSAINSSALNNNIHFVLIQNYKDFDMLIKRKANGFIFVYQRGRALLFAKPKNFAFLTYENQEFEDLASKTFLFKTLRSGLQKLKSLPSYICELRFPNIKAKYPTLWEAYESIKIPSLNEAFKEMEKQPQTSINPFDKVDSIEISEDVILVKGYGLYRKTDGKKVFTFPYGKFIFDWNTRKWLPIEEKEEGKDGKI